MHRLALLRGAVTFTVFDRGRKAFLLRMLRVTILDQGGWEVQFMLGCAATSSLFHFCTLPNTLHLCRAEKRQKASPSLLANQPTAWQRWTPSRAPCLRSAATQRCHRMAIPAHPVSSST